MVVAWKTLAAIDFDDWACKTYRANFPTVDVRCGTVAANIATLPDADVIIGGPPCQSFSAAGEQGGHEDERDGIPDFLEAVVRKRPRMFLMENVDALFCQEKFMAYLGAVIRAFEVAGYVVDYRILDAVNFGAPQFRSRGWLWGIRKDVFDETSRQVDGKNDPVCGSEGCERLRERGIDRGCGGGGGGLPTEHVEDVEAAGREDAPATEIREGEPLLPGRHQQVAGEVAGAEGGEQGAEDREDRRSALSAMRSARKYIAGPSPRLQKAIRRGLALPALPPRGAFIRNVMPWPKPTHQWPWPEPSLFGGDVDVHLKPAVVVGQALGLGGWLRKPRSKKVERRDHPTAEPSPTIEARAALGGGSAMKFIGEVTERTSDYYSGGRVLGAGEPAPAISGSTGQEKIVTEDQTGETFIRRRRAAGVERPMHPVSEPAPTITDMSAGGSASGFDVVEVLSRPSPTLVGGSQKSKTNGLSVVNDQDWRDAFRHAPPGNLGEPGSEPGRIDMPSVCVTAREEKGARHQKFDPGKTPMSESDNAWRGWGIRRLHPLECLRLQAGPDTFKWPEKIPKTAMYRIVGNGWACTMGHVFALAFHAADPSLETVIDLFCGGGLGASGWHGNFWEWKG